MPSEVKHPWLQGLSDEDVMFLKRFILASGSLKALAEEYGVSYPTIRLRLDRLIEKIKIHDSATITSAFERELRSLFVEGKLDAATMNAILAAHRSEMGEKP